MKPLTHARVVEADLIFEQELVRHDSTKLAYEIARVLMTPRVRHVSGTVPDAAH